MKRWFFCLTLLITSLLLVNCEAAPQLDISTAPQTIASTSLCGDSYVQAFAPDLISALSWQSRSRLSLGSEAQKKLPQMNASPESVLSKKDSLILLGPGESMPFHEHLPHKYELSWVETFDGVVQNAKDLSETLNLSTEKIEAWDEAVNSLTAHNDRISLKLKPKILYLTPSGGSAGSNTFVDAVIKAAGGININTAIGWHSPGIETLIQYDPDIILLSFVESDYHTRSNIMTPVIAQYLEDRKIVTIDGAYWPCAGPGLLNATQILQEGVLNWIGERDV